MAAGDVAVTLVTDATTTSIDTAMTALRTTGGANGTYGIFVLDGKVFCWGITET